ncbi:MAG: amidinotransferase [Prevotellaceae bacterium]|jgi:hypothetical protein|nr:amidinotransferase [Prevotellaceae bacterium]
MAASHFLMIRPAAFGYNPETAVNNAFQHAEEHAGIPEKALQEFDAFVDLLDQNDIDVTVVNDTPAPHTPDAIFPNNWFSAHADGTLCLFPMFAENRRLERKQTVLDALKNKFDVKHIVDFTGYETQQKFLEGTGSMVLDRENLIAYACLSPRTDKQVLLDFCKKTGYAPCCFHATDEHGTAIYHTNVMMNVGEQDAVVCLESITDGEERNTLVETLENTGKTIVPITLLQVRQFAGNMLEVKNLYHKYFLILSHRAYAALTPEQLAKLQLNNRTLLHPDLHTIETYGGGSARCMMAELFFDILR